VSALVSISPVSALGGGFHSVVTNSLLHLQDARDGLLGATTIAVE
jgi:hypothetical protein